MASYSRWTAGTILLLIILTLPLLWLVGEVQVRVRRGH